MSGAQYGSLAGWSKDAVGQRPDGAPIVANDIASDPHVVFDGTQFRMWFSAVNSKVRLGTAYATSPDGANWTLWQNPDPSRRDPVVDLVLDRTRAWEAVGIETPHVCIGPDGVWRLFYSAEMQVNSISEAVKYQIGLATSPSGLPGTWTRRSLPVMAPSLTWEKSTSSNDSQGVLEPSVLYDPVMGRYRMWYAAIGMLNGALGFRIGHATSTNGTTWVKTTQPVLVAGGAGEWDDTWVSHVNVVADPQRGFHMFYHGIAAADLVETGEYQRGWIGHAYSEDGLTWVKDPANPIMVGTPGFVDGWSCVGPSVWMRPDGITMWYTGVTDRLQFTPKILLANWQGA